MGRYSREYANKVMEAYLDGIEDIRGDMRSNFEDMDFENAQAREEAEELIAGMEQSCNGLMNRIRESRIR